MRKLSSGRMPWGSGDHHARTLSGVSTIIGKMPAQYAVINVAGSRSPPTAMRSPSGQEDGGGKAHRVVPTGSGRDNQSVMAQRIDTARYTPIDSMSRFDRFLGLARSIAIYHGIAGRHRRLRKLYRAFVGPGDLVFD